MKSLIFSILLVSALAVSAQELSLPDSTVASPNATIPPRQSEVNHDSTLAKLAVYEKRLAAYDRFWNKLIPNGVRLQYAGNMGMFSLGPVWRYGKNHQWETAIQLGIIPRHSSRHYKFTLSIKEDFIPWKIRLGTNSGFYFQPLATGLYFNTVFSDQFWTHQPDRYPKGYYWFSTRIRSNIYIGQRFKYTIPENHRQFAKGISLFYELSSCDFYIIQKVQNKKLSLGDILTLSIGLQLHWN